MDEPGFSVVNDGANTAAVAPGRGYAIWPGCGVKLGTRSPRWRTVIVPTAPDAMVPVLLFPVLLLPEAERRVLAVAVDDDEAGADVPAGAENAPLSEPPIGTSDAVGLGTLCAICWVFWCGCGLLLPLGPEMT